MWQAFAKHYWPAVYIADAEGRIRHHHFGEGGYEECERVIQQLLRESGSTDVADDLVAVVDDGFQLEADWANLRSPESYLGYEQARNFASPDRPGLDESREYVVPENLRLNQWALAGTWAIERGASVLTGAEGTLAFRFNARDVNLVLGPPARGRMTVPFRVRVDGDPPGPAHGLDADANGDGIVDRQRLYQLARQPAGIEQRTFEITFLPPGVEAYVFTFGSGRSTALAGLTLVAGRTESRPSTLWARRAARAGRPARCRQASGGLARSADSGRRAPRPDLRRPDG